MAVTAPAGGYEAVQPLLLTISASTFGTSGIVSQISGPTGNVFDVNATAYGPTGSNSDAGGNAVGLTVTNAAPLSFTPSSDSSGYDNGYAISLFVKQAGGVGDGGGSVQGPTMITNSDLILAGLPNFQTYGDYGILGISQGANGENGGSGGVSQMGGVTINNTGEIAITGNNSAVTGGDLSQAYETSITNGAAGIAAVALGGAGSGNSHGASDGGTAGSATVTDAAIVYGNYLGQGSSTDLSEGLYGILALSGGGAGGNYDDENGADGGSGGSASVTLTAGAAVDLYLLDGNTVAVPETPSAGVSAASLGGAAGIATNGNGNIGGNGGAGGLATINLTDANVATAAAKNGSLPALLALSQGGAGGCAGTQSNPNVSFYPPPQNANCNGGNTDPSQNAGNGGNADGALVNVAAQTVPVIISAQTASGNDSPAIEAYAAGGGGGYGGYNHNKTSVSHGGNGGNGGDVTGDVNVTLAATQSITVSASGANSPGIAAVSAGGAGSLSYGAETAFSDDSHGGSGGAAGNAGDVTVDLNGNANGDLQQGRISVSTDSDNSPGILAISAGGSGGQGGTADAALGVGAYGGDGGAGGASGNVEVNLYYTAISTTGTNSSPGILGFANGGAGGIGGAATEGASANPGSGGNGGQGQNVTVLTDANSSITTTGAESVGILAESLGGGGGAYGGANGAKTNSTTAGAGGNAGNVTVTNAAAITTSGASARGILAQSEAGIGGGSDATSWGLFHADGSEGGTGGAAGTVTVTNSGDINTTQSNTEGVLAQSIGGAGGAGGAVSGVTGDVGGQGGTASPGNTVTFTENDGTIGTSGYFGIGVLAQSIGGDGGDGGGASGGGSQVGGTAGTGADGATATINLTRGAAVDTSNDEADAAVVQSIGGGGGNGGNASSAEVFASTAIGGSGAAAGNGGQAWGNLDGASILTDGSKASGLIVQSIGGGGGNGGDAEAFAIGVGSSASVALGGTGSGGGNATYATADITNSLIATGQDQWLLNGTANGAQPVCPGMAAQASSGSCNTLAVDSYGVVVQSIGGGGGTGGSASAESYAIAIPSDGPSVSFAMSLALGASGGGGGAGGQAQFDLSNGSAIITAGQGSDAVLAQSVGGGGGAGGDSSEMAAVVGYGSGASITNETGQASTTDAVTVDLGRPGGGGAGDTGGAVEAALGGTWGDARNSNGINVFNPDPNGSAGTAIVTFGDYADGIAAQSIGGGGGNAGIGSGNTQSFGTSRSTSLSINLGEKGGTGGNGGLVVVGIYAPPGVSQVDTSMGSFPVGITTFGSGAIGILAQSIGGGGGSSEGGSYDVAQSFAASKTQNIKPGLNFSVGGNGVTGGEGFPVSVIVQAPVTTHGGDATGILAQSIGGGGGLGGSAGADASQDNPVIAALAGREAQGDANNIYMNYLQELEQEDPSNDNPQLNLTYALSIGGKGGTGGTGGNVEVDIDSAITTGAPISVGGQMQTDGDWADGVVAQSVGGGGGKGGTSIATGSGGVPEITLNLDHAIGGSGGSGGNGDSVTIFLGQADASAQPGSASVSTDGFGAAGVVAQSIGGGGGIGTDGSDSATGLLSVGGTGSGQSGGGGDAFTAEVETGNENTASITTAGDNADGVIVQSIGGGGGIGGAGSTAWVTNQAAWSAADSQNAQQTNTPTKLSLYVGGGARSTGFGSSATFDSTNGPLNITTMGNGAFGILVQSIGGGGGLLSAAATGTVPQVTELGGTGNDSASNLAGGTVTVNMGEEGPSTNPNSAMGIYTTGNEAFGVVAQSIGSGGGVIRLASDDSDIDPTLTTGSSAETSESGPGTGTGGQVNINMSGSSYIVVTGAGAIGIFAQSLGGGGGLIINGGSMYAGAPKPQTCSSNCSYDGAPTDIIEMQLSGPVSATGPNGIGIFAQISGEEAITNQVRADVVTYNNVTGGSGPGAVGIQVDSPAGNVFGLITNAYGTVTTENGVNGVAIENTGGGTSHVAVDGTVTGQILNANNLDLQTAQAVWNGTGYELGAVQSNGTVNAYGKLEIGSDYTQSVTGQLGIVVDSLKHDASHLQVDGNADIAGLIVPNPVSLLPGAVPIISANTLNLTATGLGSLLFSWNVAAADNTANLTPFANFRPAGTPLSDSETSLAAYLQRGWGNVDAGLATEFANLSRIEDTAQYKQTLDAFSGKATEAQSVALINAAGTILGASLSCPVYIDQGVRFSDDSCVWMKVTAQQSNQWKNGDTQGYRVGSVTTRLGGEKEFNPDWYVGGSIAIGQTSASEDGTAQGDSGGHGQTYDGSISLKHRSGPWLLAGSIAIADGEYQSDRVINIPGVAASLQGNPSVFLTGARFRAGYEFAFNNLYVQPYGDFDLLYTNLRGFRETGPAPYALNVQGSGKVTVAFSPMVELGGRIDLNAKTVLRPYAELGASFIPDNSRSIDAAFTGTSSADGLFHSNLDSPEMAANFGAGVQLYRAGGLELKAEYDATIGGSYLSQSASARFAYDF